MTKEIAKYEVDSARRNVIEEAGRAIATMERFLADAKRDLARVKEEPDAKCFDGDYRLSKLGSDVLHALSWGMANASANIERATSEGTRYAVAQAILNAEVES